MTHVRSQIAELERRVNKVAKQEEEIENILRRLRRLEMIVKPPVKGKNFS